MTVNTRHPASYKDPSGFVFHSSGKIYRQINKVYATHYELLIQSGLYDLLQKKNILLPHQELKENLLDSGDWYLTLQPEKISVWSYPYEWCFEQLKDAALQTLEIVKLSVEKGMILKDATPFNIQFLKGLPVLIDSLSFEKYEESMPWKAYRQFCENFLFPLWLSHYHKMNLQNLLSVYPEGIPVSVTAKLLPAKSSLNPAIWMHVILQNILSKKKKSINDTSHFSKKKLLNIITHLQNIITTLDNGGKTAWSHYYQESASPDYITEKEKIVLELLRNIQGSQLIDLGANDGYFSWLASENNFTVIAADNDEQCINTLYKKVKQKKKSTLLPLCIDITNPPAASGFGNKERTSFNERMCSDAAMALALIHHLTIGKNIPFSFIAAWLSSLAPQLIIEFVPKEDDKVQLLLQNKKDIYTAYTKEEFEKQFCQYYTIITSKVVPGTVRTIYLMKIKGE